VNWWQAAILGLALVALGAGLVWLVLARAYARIEAQWKQIEEDEQP
jgi:hypothetical protein